MNVAECTAFYPFNLAGTPPPRLLRRRCKSARTLVRDDGRKRHRITRPADRTGRRREPRSSEVIEDDAPRMTGQPEGRVPVVKPELLGHRRLGWIIQHTRKILESA
jgi:hypothetical protein